MATDELPLSAKVPPAQIAAASAIARPERWRSLHENAGLLWGRFQGSALYDVACALVSTAFHCTCPAFASGRRPCKHSVALLLVHARSPEAFASEPPPDWVARFAEKAQRRATPKEPAPIADPEAQARRAAGREARIMAGLDELER